ncbi:Pentatricopeptide repeat-containing protein [Acorus calamus]|uniref:Pentatricopeptide repeat-containing protein n=1 Tax=Acorus calamus TaxID=4465 RepID=A0AAV9FKL0_ACOCL|nr:Pentatricopeptide repeat-containing protein [Acorus calamus]
MGLGAGVWEGKDGGIWAFVEVVGGSVKTGFAGERDRTNSSVLERRILHYYLVVESKTSSGRFNNDRSGLVSVAQKTFDGMPHRDRVSWNSIASEYAAVGEMEEAMALFMRMSERD